MLFLGTKTFPSEEEFSQYLSSRGGYSNAYTDSEDTVYYFECNSASLDGAIARFSQFFICPLFSAGATSREVNAIDSENAKNINNDGFRLYQLDRNLFNPSHPMNRFATGNKVTLEEVPLSRGIDIRQALLEFHGQYYSADKMTLAVIGPQSCGQLEAMVKGYFSSVPQRLSPRPALGWWGVPPFRPQARPSATLLEVVPVAEIRRLSVSWPIWFSTPNERTRFDRVKPEQVKAFFHAHSALYKCSAVCDCPSGGSSLVGS